MTVQLLTSGAQRALDATASVTVTDPNSEVSVVQFMIGQIGGSTNGPYPADAINGNVYDKVVPLDVHRLTRVTPVVTLSAGGQQQSAPAVFGVRNEPINVAAGVLSTVSITGGTRAFTVSLAAGTAQRWRCYARCGAMPTTFADDRSALQRQYLRFDGDMSVTSFTSAAIAGTWYCVVLGYNASGQAGPRTVATIQVAP